MFFEWLQCDVIYQVWIDFLWFEGNVCQIEYWCIYVDVDVIVIVQVQFQQCIDGFDFDVVFV